MKKLIIILLIIVVLITVVVAKDKIKETDKYKAYKVKVKDNDAITFEIKENKSMTGIEIVKEFEKIKEEK